MVKGQGKSGGEGHDRVRLKGMIYNNFRVRVKVWSRVG
jgi:hypothetical protein